MDTFKKIYIAIMGLTVISALVLCLYSLEMVDYGSNESLYRILLLSTAIFSISFLFSRSANVIANRKNTAFAYIAVFIGLAFVLGAALEVIFEFEISFNTIYIIICVLICATLPILVLEVPPANSSHTKFQIITVFLILVSFIWNASSLYQSINSYTDYSYDYSEEDEEDSKSDTIKTVITFGGILCFLLNPMIRVHYLEVDYELTKEIDNILKDGMENKNIPKRTVVPKTEEKKIENPKPMPMIQEQNSGFINNSPTNSNIPVDNTPIQDIVESQGMTPDGKVINPNFKQEDLVEAIIPTIDGADSTYKTEIEVPVGTDQVQIPTSDNNEIVQPLQKNLQQPPTINNENKEPNKQ